jgi:glycosyltransferase involved in cell wall biosynthesis
MILFITRKFPPRIGGMQKVAYELYRHLSRIAEVKLVKWSGSNKWLPLVLPYFLLQSFYLLLSKKIDTIYLQDGLLAPIGFVLKVFRKPIVITIHGLDITYKSRAHQFLIPRCVRRLDRIICVSSATKQASLRRGIPKEKITIIPHGISQEFYLDMSRAQLEEALFKHLELDLSNKKIILSVGRLVERKGVHWFVENIMPQICADDKDCVYLIAGDGKEKARIKQAITLNGLEGQVFLLGMVSGQLLKYLYNVADIFVMPNLPVEGDTEGFGIVALEAASRSLPVVASNLEGIKDAVKDKENGFLVEPGDTQGFVRVIDRLLANDWERKEFAARAREFTMENYGWEKIAKLYLEELKAQ